MIHTGCARAEEDPEGPVEALPLPLDLAFRCTSKLTRFAFVNKGVPADPAGSPRCTIFGLGNGVDDDN